MTAPFANASTVATLPGRMRLLAADIKLSHSVFALPFALLATFLAAGWAGRLPDAATLGLIVLCMVLARTWAMCVNRWADAPLDAGNPRTAGRAIPRGALPRSFVLAAGVVCAAAFVAATSLFYLRNANAWPLLLSPLVLAYLAFYSFTKRFTVACHVVLGSALALSPVAAAIAVEPGYLSEPTVWLLAVMVTGWVAGFDVIYALQDVAIDQRDGLCSLPARLGAGRALWISRALHVLALTVLVIAWRESALLGGCFGVGLAVIAGLLLLEHVVVHRGGAGRIQMAFFTLNGLVSLALGALGIADVVLSVG